MNNQKSIKIKDLKTEYVRFFDPLFSLIKKLINILNYFLYKGFTKEFNPMNHLGAIANLFLELQQSQVLSYLSGINHLFIKIILL
jgi:hypothetical protein